MYCYLIISKLGYLINNYFQSKITNQPNNKNKTINKNLLFNSLYTHDFIIKFFDNTLDEKECESFFEINIKRSIINLIEVQLLYVKDHHSYLILNII